MSSLLKDLEFKNKYQIINGGDIQSRLLRYYRNIDLNKLNNYQKLDISNDLILELKKEINHIKDNNCRVLFVGDYDTDGVCSLSIMLRLFEHLDIQANYYIPSRTKEGYGLNENIVQRAIDYHFDYIITLDNGTNAKKALKLANDNKINVIIIDHHEYETLPECNIFIHPSLLDAYFKYSCTAALAYLISRLYYYDEYSAVLAMIASIGDVMEMFLSNRQIVKEGLELFNNNPNIALNIKSLINKKTITSEDVSFQIVPKINAISRLDPLANLNTFIPYFKNGILDVTTAEKIIYLNNLRKEKTSEMVIDAYSKISNEDKIIIINNDKYLEGLCGIVAGKIAQEYQRPCIVLAKNNMLKGSGRSYGDFDLYNYLNNYKDLFESFGGHKKAVGLEIAQNNLNQLKNAIADISIDYNQDIIDVIEITEDELNEAIISIINEYEPFGEGIKKPLFYLNRPSIKSRFLIKGLYPKYTLTNNHELFGFEKAQFVEEMQGVIGTLDISKYNSKKITLSIKEIVL